MNRNLAKKESSKSGGQPFLRQPVYDPKTQTGAFQRQRDRAGTNSPQGEEYKQRSQLETLLFEEWKSRVLEDGMFENEEQQQDDDQPSKEEHINNKALPTPKKLPPFKQGHSASSQKNSFSSKTSNASQLP